jgi:hypothetical protein
MGSMSNRGAYDPAAAQRDAAPFREDSQQARSLVPLLGPGRGLRRARDAAGESRKTRRALATPAGSSQWTKWPQLSKRIISQFSSKAAVAVPWEMGRMVSRAPQKRRMGGKLLDFPDPVEGP